MVPDVHANCSVVVTVDIPVKYVDLCNVMISKPKVPPDKGGSVVETRVLKPHVMAYLFSTKAKYMQSNGSFRIMLDSGCGKGVTPCLNLFGKLALKRDMMYKVSGWSGEPVCIDSHGDTIFDDMLYAPHANCTLLCFYDVVTYWICDISLDREEWKLRHPIYPDIILVFVWVDKVLICDVPEDMWALLCDPQHIHVDVMKVETTSTLVEETSIQANAVSVDASMYRHVLECVHLHSVACHPGDSLLCRTLTNQVLVNCPLSTAHVGCMSWLRPSCVNCELAKSIRKSHGKRKQHKESSEDRPEADTDRVEPSEVVNSAVVGEVLGIDLWFFNNHVFLITRGIKHRYIHVIPLKSKDKKVVCLGIGTVIKDYLRHRINLSSVFNSQDANAREIYGIVSDGEGAFIQAGLDLLPEYGITTVVVASGDHVKVVERPIRDIKARIRAKLSEMPFHVNDDLMIWLAVNVTNWINIMSCDAKPYSAFRELHGYSLQYRDVVRTGIFDTVVAHRSALSLSDGQARGEAGMSLGFVPSNPTAIYFYSFDTQQVKPRTRYVKIRDVDLVAMFGKNRFYAPPMVFDKSYTAFKRSQPGVCEPTMKREPPPPTPTPVASDYYLSDGPPTDGISRNLPNPGSYLTSDVSDELESPSSGDYSYPVVNSVPESLEDNLPSVEPVWHSSVGDDRWYTEDTPALPILEGLNLPAVDAKTESGMYEVELPDVEAYNPDVIPDIKLESEEMDLLDSVANEQELHDHIKAELDTNDIKPTIIEPRRSSRVPGKGFAKPYANCHVDVSLMSVIAMSYVDTIARVVNCYGLSKDVSVNMGWTKGVSRWTDLATTAIKKEVQQVIDYEVFHPTFDCPKDFCMSHDLIDEKADGTIKARLVTGKTAYGSVIEYDVPLYSPTIDAKLIFTMLSVNLKMKSQFEVWDVKGAFLQAPMRAKEEVYVRLAPHVASMFVSLNDVWTKFLRKDGSMMVVCDRAWYGTAAASSLWNADITETLIGLCGYVQHSMAACLFYKHIDGITCFILLHVDDLGVSFPPGGVERDRVCKILEDKYGILKKKSGESVVYVGLEISSGPHPSTFRVGMCDRIEKFAKDNRIGEHTKSVLSPAKNVATFNCPSEKQCADLLDAADTTKYRSAVMTMNYITIVQPCIKFYVAWLATRQSAPSVSDWEKALHLMTYLYGVRHECVVIGAMKVNPTITVYTDAAFDVHRDSKSHSGIAIFISGSRCAVFCTSNKQSCLARSSCDSEIITLESGTFLGTYWKDVLEEIGIVTEVVYMEDNQSCIVLVSTGTQAYDRKERHVVRRINYLYDHFKAPTNKSTVVFCPTLAMIADILTKALPADLFMFFSRFLMGMNTSFDVKFEK